MRLGIPSWLVAVALVVVLSACGGGGAGDGSDTTNPPPDGTGQAEVDAEVATGDDALSADGVEPVDTAAPGDTALDAAPSDAGGDQATGPDATPPDADAPDATDAVTPPPDCSTTGCGPTATCTAGPDGVPGCVCNAGYQDDGQGGCQKDPVLWTEGVEGDATVAENVVLVEATTADGLQVADYTVTLPLAGNEDAVETLPGKLIVSGDGAGFLRQVVGAQIVGDAVVLDTVPGDLAQLFGDAELKLALPLGPPQVGAEAPGARGAWIDWDKSGTVLWEAEETLLEGSVVTSKIWLEKAKFSFDPTFEWDYTASWGTLHYLRFGVKGDAIAAFEIDAGVGYQGKVKRTYEVPLTSARVVVLVAGVPVVFTPSVQLDIVLEADIAANGGGRVCALVKTGASSTATLDAAVWYLAEDAEPWHLDDVSHLDSDAQAPIIEGSSTLKATAKFTASFVFSTKVYDVAGPYVTLAPNATAEISNSLCDWKVSAGLTSALGLKTKVFGFNVADFEATLFDVQEPVFQGSCPCDPEAYVACAEPINDAAQVCNQACLAYETNTCARTACFAECSATSAAAIQACLPSAGCLNYQGSTQENTACQKVCADQYLACVAPAASSNPNVACPYACETAMTACGNACTAATDSTCDGL